MRWKMWREATCSMTLLSSMFTGVVFSLVLFSVVVSVLPCASFKVSAGAPKSAIYNRNNGVTLRNPCRTSRNPVRHGEDALLASPESIFSPHAGETKSLLLSELLDRGMISQVTDLHKLDEFLCSHEAGNTTFSGKVPAVYYGIDLTNNFIHEGTLFQLLVLRRFLAYKFNVVVVLGGGTTVVGDPSFRSRPSKASLSSYDQGVKQRSVITGQEFICPQHNSENESAILGIVEKILAKPIESGDGKLVKPSVSFASNMDEDKLNMVVTNPYNAIVLNNRSLYDKIRLTEYLSAVAQNVSVGRMLSRDCIRSRMAFGEGDERKLQVNLSLAELMYMTLQATDFVHVASKFNAIVQLGGSDQMGNIISGVDLAASFGDPGPTLFGITTPLLQTPTGEKISKSVGESLLKITTRTRPLTFWSHFRNVDDPVVGDYLRWLTDAPLELIKEKMQEHINEAKVLLADRLTTAVLGKEYTDCIHRYWLSRDTDWLTKSRFEIPAEDYESFSNFLDCAHSVTLGSEELDQGIEFGDLLDMLRTPQMVSGYFHSNRRAIREGACRVNGQVVTSVKAKVTSTDLLQVSSDDGRQLRYITINFGKRQVYFVKLRQS